MPTQRIKEQVQTYKDSRAIHDMRRAKGLASKAPFKPKWIDSFIEGIPSDTIADDLVYDVPTEAQCN